MALQNRKIDCVDFEANCEANWQLASQLASIEEEMCHFLKTGSIIFFLFASVTSAISRRLHSWSFRRYNGNSEKVEAYWCILPSIVEFGRRCQAQSQVCELWFSEEARGRVNSREKRGAYWGV